MADSAATTPEDWASVAIKWSQKNLEPRCDVVLSEVFVATNFNTGDVFLDPEVKDRQYPELPGFMPGTADLVCILSNGRLLVADWKTGGGTGAREQLLSLGCGLRASPFLRKANGEVRDVTIAVLYSGPDSMPTATWGDVQCYEEEVSDDVLVAHARAMEFQLQDVGKRTEHVQGSHCTQLFCPHLAYCDAVLSDVWMACVEDDVGSKLPILGSVSVLTDSPKTDEEAGLVMARIAAARRQMKYYEEGIRRYVDEGGRAVEGDWEYKHTNSGYRWVKARGNAGGERA